MTVGEQKPLEKILDGRIDRCRSTNFVVVTVTQRSRRSCEAALQLPARTAAVHPWTSCFPLPL
jgi:hypothetical protein